MIHRSAALADLRREERVEVHYRARATHADGRALALLLVNVSPGGFMARCETAIAEGDRLYIVLPGLGRLAADVRWALGGRIGCQLAPPIARLPYDELLTVLLRG